MKHGPESRPFSGEIVRISHSSEVLKGNPLGDSAVRDLLIYLPRHYHQSHQRYPVLWHLAAFTNSGRAATNWRGFDENLFQRVDRLIHDGAMGEVIVVSPDCFTSLGGNQYLNSPAIGSYSDYIHHELIPFVDDEFKTLSSRAHRGVFGKSSGGYGALMLAMKYPEYWGGLANHSGDAHFDVVYRPDFPAASRTLSRHGGDIEAFIEQFWSNDQRGGDDFMTLMLCCLAASYDPSERIELPFDLRTLAIDQTRWNRWLQHDPMTQIETHRKALDSMHLVYMDCGDRDQYNIHHGARLLSDLMTRHDIEHEYHEFSGTHSGIDHRLDVSLPRLHDALSD